MITQKDIARKAGVHQSHVSLALKNHPVVAEATRKKIQAIAKSMGYRPNAALSAAASNRWRQEKGMRRETVAFIRSVPTRKEKHILNFNLLKQHLDHLGYGLRVVQPQDYHSEKSMSRALYNSGIRGILLDQQSNEDRLRALDWQHFAIVQCGLLRRNILSHIVMLDFQELINEALQKALQAGFKRALILLPEEGLFYSDYLMNQAARGAQHSEHFKECSIEIMTVKHDPHNQSIILRKIQKLKPEVIIQGINKIHCQFDHYQQIKPRPIPISLNGDWEADYIPGFESQTHNLWHIAAELMDSLLRTHNFGLPKVPKRIKFVPAWKDVPLTQDWHHRIPADTPQQQEIVENAQ